MFIDIRERGRETKGVRQRGREEKEARDREREKHLRLVASHMRANQDQPATFWCIGQRSNQLRHPAREAFFIISDACKSHCSKGNLRNTAIFIKHKSSKEQSCVMYRFSKFLRLKSF